MAAPPADRDRNSDAGLGSTAPCLRALLQQAQPPPEQPAAHVSIAVHLQHLHLAPRTAVIYGGLQPGGA
jgi:hypothetical protein